MTEPRPAATDTDIDAADGDLGVVQTLLQSDDAVAVEAATALLFSVDRALRTLASAPDTDTETARRLLSIRADLSGHLLAAGALETAGAPAAGVARMLRRAAEIARAGLGMRAPVGVGRG